ncbi:MAG: hypothetical protein NVSMB31_00860 [Vulcanimicrobiaceae bacterium]
MYAQSRLRPLVLLFVASAASYLLAGCGGGSGGSSLAPATPIGAGVSYPVGANATRLSESWQQLPMLVPWVDGSTSGDWLARYDGYGKTQVVAAADLTRALELSPKASIVPTETHAGLVTSVRSFTDVDAVVRMQTVEQLRTPAPNTWETGWFLWHYQDDVHFYYVILKPNGWELGKEDPAYPDAQRFLATGDSPHFPIGSTNTLRIVQVGPTITVSANGTVLTTFTDGERPYTSGALGLYCEDARVHFGSVSASPAS